MHERWNAKALKMFQRVISQICWISLVVTLVLQLMNCVWADDAVKKHQIEFKNDIWPILTNHCLRCHGPERSEGGLRLDRKKFVLKGGHTGNPVLGTLQNSELLRRVTSTNDAYRMPKDATPLSNVEKELLQKWIEQGSNWPTQRSTAGTASNVNLNRGFSVDDLASLFERFGVATEPMRPLLGPFFFFLVLVMYAERIRQKPATTPSVEDSRSNRFQNWLMTNFRIPQYMIGILIFSNLGMWLFHRSTNPFSKEQSTTKTATNDEQEDLEYQFVAKAPKIYTPKRNRQFGGAYYRGNDERNNKLFNGGYYRTCTFYLALRDQSERQLQPGMNIDGAEIFIELVIERAPFATRELFRDEAITSSVLTSRFVDSGPPGQFPDEANFQT
ncbi:MAG: hypothetical protein FJ267_04935, partial [Planctomycetes bacterium]|nr:hypothetical protein [Planctomycetota bacterium]